jgi:biotin operon repressor
MNRGKLLPRYLMAYKRKDGTIGKYRVYQGDRKRPSRRLLRQWQLLRFLAAHPRPTSISELSRIFGVNRESIRHDIELLIRAGFGIRKERNRMKDNVTEITLIGCCKAAPECCELAQPASGRAHP